MASARAHTHTHTHVRTHAIQWAMLVNAIMTVVVLLTIHLRTGCRETSFRVHSSKLHRFSR